MKALAGIAAAVISFLTMASIGANRAPFDYRTASEERQQQYLDNILAGFKLGFRATSMGMADIERATANADWDVISIDIRFNDPSVGSVSSSRLEAFRREMYQKNCAHLDRKGFLANGTAMKIRMNKPAGGRLTSFTFDAESCASWLS